MQDSTPPTGCAGDLSRQAPKELTASEATNDLSRETWLVYNNHKSIKIDRTKVAKSCWYFEHLLEGQFKEAKQHSIEMNLGDAFCFEAFRCLIKFANDGQFLRDPNSYEIHLEAIQLGLLLGYDKFVNVVQDHIIEKNLCRREIDVLTSLASSHLPQLQKLKDACDRLAEKMVTRERRPLFGCSVDGHRNHMYLHCRVRPKVGDLNEDDWEARVTDVIDEEERDKLALIREEDAMRRHKFHDRTLAHIMQLQNLKNLHSTTNEHCI